MTVALSFPDVTHLSSSVLVGKHHNAESIFMYDETFRTLAYKNEPNLLLGTKDVPYHLLVTLRDHNEQKLRSRMHSFIKALTLTEDSWELSDEATLAKALSPEFLEKTLSVYTKGAHVPVPIASGIIVSLHDYTSLFKEIEDYMHSQGRVYTLTGYAGSGHISLTVLFDPRSLLYENDVTTYMYDIYSLVKKHRGGISASGGDGYAKTPYLQLFYSEPTMQIFKKIKEIWDPLLVLNPGKKLDISTNTLQKYLRKV
jgi:FAD/FMN-containing dehydrogenase